jgi:hypothetical protein
LVQVYAQHSLQLEQAVAGEQQLCHVLHMALGVRRTHLLLPGCQGCKHLRLLLWLLVQHVLLLQRVMLLW